jgi:hypothetical protein
MRLVNLTNDVIVLHDVDGKPVELQPDPRHVGVVALGEHRRVEDGSGHVFSLNTRIVREVKGMPEPQAGTVFIVSTELAMVLQEVRDDVVFPAEASEIRDRDGHLVRVTHLRRVVRRLA